MSKVSRNLAFAGMPLIGTLMGSAAVADSQSPMPEQCEIHAQEQLITLLLCSPDAQEEVFVNAGKAACEARLPCGAWIWSDATDLPTDPRLSHQELTQAEVTSAVGVWVAEQAIWIQIDKAE